MAVSMLRRLLLVLCLGSITLGAAAAPPMNRQQALRTLTHPVAAERASAVARLADLGQMADASRVAERLRDDDEDVRALATSALWMIWSRSGDRQIDRLFARGMQQMSAGDLDAALATFSRVVQKKPAFAEGWNKRATVRFMLGDDAASLKDCEETLKRNPLHFGALSGMAHIHLRRGNADLALRAYTRALQANPNLEDGPEMLQQLEDAVRRQGGQRT